MQGADTGDPVVAEEAVQDPGEVETGDDKAAQVGDQRHVGRVGGGGVRGGGVDGGVALGGEEDVEEGGDGEDGTGVLGVVEEVALAGLVLGVPFEDVELWVVGLVWGEWFGGRGGEGGGGVGELGVGVVGGGWLGGWLLRLLLPGRLLGRSTLWVGWIARGRRGWLRGVGGHLVSLDECWQAWMRGGRFRYL